MKSIRERNPITIAVLGIVVMVAVGLLTYFSDDLPVIGGGIEYSADFSEAAGLQSGDEVRVAGVLVGHVSSVGLDGNHVKVTFKVKDTWLGNATTVAIKIKTLLGAKYLSVDPLGAADQNPDRTIPASRTVSPFDVTQAFNGLATTVGQIDTRQLANSFETIATTFGNTAPDVHAALQGLSALSQTIASRDNQLAQLLSNTRQVTASLAGEDGQFQTLLNDGNLLLGELQQRKNVIGSLLTGTQALATQLSGLVTDDSATLGPMLTELDQVTAVLQQNQDNLAKALSLAGPYYRLLGNALGNGRWMDSYLCGLVPSAGSGCQPPRSGGS